MDLQLVFDLLAGLVGLPALIAALVNVAKYFKLLTDGSAPKAVFVLNVIAFVGVAAAVFFGKVDLLPGIDTQLGAVANILLAILALLSNLGVSRGFHNRILRGAYIVGYSHGTD